MALKVQYLVKDELLFELLARGREVSTELSVNTLRKNLRSAVRDNIPFKVSNLVNVVNPSQELSLIQAKLVLIEDSVSELSEKSPLLSVAKCQEKLNHLGRRISFLEGLKLDEEPREIFTVCKAKVDKLVETVSKLVPGMNAERLSELEQQLDKSLTEAEMEEEGNCNPTSIPRSELPATTQPICEPGIVPSASTPSQPQTVPVFDINNQYPNNLHKNSTSLSMFGKISNPIEKYLQNFKITNGLNPSSLLVFIKNMLKLKNETSLSHLEILNLLPCYAEEPLLNKILECKNNMPNVDYLHRELLAYFLPFGMLERLKQDLIFRPQRHYEPLPVYIYDIKNHSDILLSSLTEQQLVESIIRGINPEDRNKLIFMSKPTSFKDLESICVASNNIGFNDHLRNDAEQPRLNVVRPPHAEYRPRRNNNLLNQGPKLCFSCNRPGHLAKNCYRSPKNL